MNSTTCKRFISLAIAGVLLLSFAACGNTREQPEEALSEGNNESVSGSESTSSRTDIELTPSTPTLYPKYLTGADYFYSVFPDAPKSPA